MSKQSEHGKRGEELISDLLHERGYWSHIFAKSLNGSQPFDVIAVSGNPADVWMVDAKFVRGQSCSFPFSRIEPNQLSSMEFAINFAGVSSKHIGFAIIFERDIQNIRFITYSKVVEMIESGIKSVNMSQIEKM